MFSIFRKSGFDPNEFEKELSSITQKISTTSQQISRLKIGRDSSKRKVLLICSATYILFLGYIYATSPTTISNTKINRLQLFITSQTKHQLLFLLLYPVVGYGIYTIVHWFYTFLINSKSNQLINLKKKHKQKIEDLKRITNFNTTNELLDKFGDEKDKPKPKSNLSTKPKSNLPTQIPNNPTINRSGVIDVNKLSETQLKKLNINITPNKPLPQQTPQSHAQSQIQSSTPPPPKVASTPPKRTFQDRILDLLIGSDNSEAVENRYALICYKCYAHNGLAPPHTDNPSAIKFKCMQCGTLNGHGVLDAELKDLINESLSEDVKKEVPDPVTAENEKSEVESDTSPKEKIESKDESLQ
ncbi:uncharacterized protein RJT21DRAFT_46191 [Scheffersomyces amazonensis]|uniref:uncharacterized protein n=1 Tax=Scheffersomyces amazonensis TaxID=1078765 RepID=UPI00315C8D2A